MMTEREKLLDLILTKIANEISITSAMIDQAVSSYQAVGKWIGDGIEYDTQIFPQGSMNLGTTIKPISEKDDYDIDLVCLLKNGTALSSERIKNIVGDRLKENEIYRQKIKAEGEGKRCWKMQYNAFHMDILPCVPQLDYYIEPFLTDIRLTHKLENGLYISKYSNPYGYGKWFEERMKDILYEKKRSYAMQNKTEIEKVPTYRVKTPLQMVIQLLKRHRDICFENDSDNAPISIIITTLSAKAYDGQIDLYSAMCQILNHMADYIEIKGKTYWVENPVMPEENFADKWEQYPERKTAFEQWLNRAHKELISDPLEALGLDKLKERYAAALGDAPVNRAFKNYADEMHALSQQNKLYSSGLMSGLSSTMFPGSQTVKGHTFFGE